MQWSHDKCFALTIMQVSEHKWCSQAELQLLRPLVLLLLLILLNFLNLRHVVGFQSFSECPPEGQVPRVSHPDISKGPKRYWLHSEYMTSSKIISMSVFLCDQPLAFQAIHFELPSSYRQTWRLQLYLVLRWQLRLKMDWREARGGCAVIW